MQSAMLCCMSGLSVRLSEATPCVLSTPLCCNVEGGRGREREGEREGGSEREREVIVCSVYSKWCALISYLPVGH